MSADPRPGATYFINHYAIPTDCDVQNEHAQLLPRLAVEVPSLERGTWNLHPDGTMEMVWKIHPNARWHDAQPITADDLVFGYELHRNRSFQLSGPLCPTLRG
ncbi:MAG: hypothetical protein GEU73_01005 [Chloroflexi bacterium]|nr:hypothetical protein [Chloroflexota bacterium]